MIKALIFDCFGVLTTDTWLKFVDSLPEGVDVNAVRETHRAYTRGIISKQESAQRIEELCHGQCFIEPEDREGIAKNNLLLDYIRELKGQGYKIGLLSNIGTGWIRDQFLAPEEQQLFDDMILSYEVGLIKPDPRIYHLACERLGVEPDEAVMVDDIERYTEAAKAEGLNAIVYNDFKQFQKDISALLKNS